MVESYPELPRLTRPKFQKSCDIGRNWFERITANGKYWKHGGAVAYVFTELLQLCSSSSIAKGIGTKRATL